MAALPSRTAGRTMFKRLRRPKGRLPLARNDYHPVCHVGLEYPSRGAAIAAADSREASADDLFMIDREAGLKSWACLAAVKLARITAEVGETVAS